MGFVLANEEQKKEKAKRRSIIKNPTKKGIETREGPCLVQTLKAYY